jgi:hypothetical protein
MRLTRNGPRTGVLTPILNLEAGDTCVKFYVTETALAMSDALFATSDVIFFAVSEASLATTSLIWSSSSRQL